MNNLTKIMRIWGVNKKEALKIKKTLKNPPSEKVPAVIKKKVSSHP